MCPGGVAWLPAFWEALLFLSSSCGSGREEQAFDSGAGPQVSPF